MFKKKLLEAVTKFSSLPLVRGVSRRVSIVGKKIAGPILDSAGAIECGMAFRDSFNPRLPIPHRIISAGKGTCCTAALISAHMSRRIPNPYIAARFRVCCYAFTGAYYISGGNFNVGLGILASSNAKLNPFNQNP